jgi:hypothetical protein
MSVTEFCKTYLLYYIDDKTRNAIAAYVENNLLCLFKELSNNDLECDAIDKVIENTTKYNHMKYTQFAEVLGNMTKTDSPISYTFINSTGDIIYDLLTSLCSRIHLLRIDKVGEKELLCVNSCLVPIASVKQLREDYEELKEADTYFPESVIRKFVNISSGTYDDSAIRSLNHIVDYVVSNLFTTATHYYEKHKHLMDSAFSVSSNILSSFLA